MTTKEFRAGYVALVGRPNVGKSTLLNRFVGQKVSITSRKPQTTRQRVTGVLTLEFSQLVFVDTPGFQTRHGGALNRGLNRVVTQALAEVDVIVMVVESLRYGEEDQAVAELLPHNAQPLLLAINKADKVGDKTKLLPFIQQISSERAFADIVPISATKGHGVPKLAEVISAHLPVQEALYASDELTESSERMMASELIREKLFRMLGEELPYSCAVMIDSFVMEGTMRRIDASIIVDKDSQKGIVVGEGGSRLKEIGTKARLDMEKLFGSKVYLKLWVKVKNGWTENTALLKQMGFRT